MDIKKGSKRRFWSDEEKRSICLQTLAPGVSVAQVGRRYAMNANLIHTWLRDPRFAPSDEPDASSVADDAVFLPVEITSVAIDANPSPSTNEATHSPPLTAHRIDIELSDGRRIVIEGTTALASVVAMVEGLSA